VLIIAAMEERVEGLNEVKANKVDVVMVADLANLMAEQAEQLDGRLAEYRKDNSKVGCVCMCVCMCVCVHMFGYPHGGAGGAAGWSVGRVQKGQQGSMCFCISRPVCVYSCTDDLAKNLMAEHLNGRLQSSTKRT